MAFPIDFNLGKLKFVRASKFLKLPIQQPGNDDGQSFTAVGELKCNARTMEMSHSVKL